MTDASLEWYRRQQPSGPIPERHAWLRWDGGRSVYANDRPVPVTDVEWSSVSPERQTDWGGWEAIIKLETGISALLFSATWGCNELRPEGWWTAPSMHPCVLTTWPETGETNELEVKLATNGVFETWPDCDGFWCDGCWHHCRGHQYRTLHADEDLWQALADWSVIPLVRRDKFLAA